MNEATKNRIQQTIDSSDVVLFMKGQRRLPQCGFSAQVISILDQIVDNYETVNVLSDPEIREGIKLFSQWPTIPQLYVRGKFVGGCDIVTQMFENGDLHKELGKDMPAIEAPTVTVNDEAAKALKGALEGADGAFVRLTIDPAWRPGLDITPMNPSDMKVDAGAITLIMDRGTAQRANGVSIAFVPGDRGGFKIENPNEPPRVKPIAPADLRRRLDEGEALELIDVRTPQEMEIAKIAGGKLLDDSVKAHIEGLPRDTTLVFFCHHGPRAENAANFFLNAGFTKVYNLAGGIDAWAREVDNTIARY